MTMMTSYPNGYGRRDRPPECREGLHTVDCPCCEGASEHEFGAGMDRDAAACRVCRGQGIVGLVPLEPAGSPPPKARCEKSKRRTTGPCGAGVSTWAKTPPC